MNGRETKKRLAVRMDLATQNLAPAYFALVMATGAVSLAAQDMDLLLLTHLLFWFNIGSYGTLWILSPRRGQTLPPCCHLRSPGCLAKGRGHGVHQRSRPLAPARTIA